MLTRAAFAVMVKFSRQNDLLDAYIEAIEFNKSIDSIPSEAGPDQNSALIKSLESVPDSDNLVQSWANATKMRSWLNLKKTSYHDRFKDREDEDAVTTESLEEVFTKIVNKAEFLVAMQIPPM